MLYSSIAGPIALVGLIFLGVALFWARQVVYHNQSPYHRDTVRLILSISAAVLILVGVLGAMVHVTFILAPLACVLVLVIVPMLVMRYRSVERRSLLKCVAVAAQKGIPLDQAVAAFASERSDEIGFRAALLAQLLQRGMSLPDALAEARTGLPTAALFAMRLGCETGKLGVAVARVAKTDENLEILARSLCEKFLYLAFLVTFLIVSLFYLMLAVIPQFQRLIFEFNVDIPPVTQASIEIADWLGQFWPLLLPLIVPALALFTAMGVHYIGLLPHGLMGFNWLTRRSDSSLVMRALAMAVAFHWPMNKTVWMLARIYPKRGMRQRLAEAGRLIDNGTDWCDSLWRARVYGRPECGVLRAAQRVGNLEWAFEEMADGTVRRLIYRSRLFMNMVFPLVILAFGFLVAFFVVAFFIPLVRMVEVLA